MGKGAVSSIQKAFSIACVHGSECWALWHTRVKIFSLWGVLFLGIQYFPPSLGQNMSVCVYVCVSRDLKRVVCPIYPLRPAVERCNNALSDMYDCVVLC